MIDDPAFTASLYLLASLLFFAGTVLAFLCTRKCAECAKRKRTMYGR